MTEEPEASVLTARRAPQHVRLSSADDAYEQVALRFADHPPQPSNSSLNYIGGVAAETANTIRGYSDGRASDTLVPPAVFPGFMALVFFLIGQFGALAHV
jgi:hypothetical protein